jgi:hypothetical protein
MASGEVCRRRPPIAGPRARGSGEGQAVEREVAAQEMGWSHVRDQRPKNEGVCDLAECQHDGHAGEETARTEFRADQRGRQHRE